MSLIIPANTLASGGFAVDNSCRFNDGSSDYLTRTPSSSGNRDKYTLSFWFKRSGIGTVQKFFNAKVDGSNFTEFGFESSDVMQIYNYNSGSVRMLRETNRVFRDVSAWYHLVLKYDSSQSTASDRFKIYINGVEETSFSSSTEPALNEDSNLNVSSAVNTLGRSQGDTYYFDGYMAEVVLLDGTALAADSFGEFDEDSGIFKPIDVSGLTFGTNGFYLDFENSSALGNDVSGNNNDFTANNLTAIDQSTDTCTNNFATLNPIQAALSSATFSEGNLKSVTAGTAGENFGGGSSIGVASGKWYFEAKATVGSGSADRNVIGVTGELSNIAYNKSYTGTSSTVQYQSYNGKVLKNNSDVYTGSTYATGNIIQIALDIDNLHVYFGKDGTWQNSGNPESGATGTGAVDLVALTSTTDGFYFIYHGDNSGASGPVSTFEFNFGSPAFSISSGNADGNGYGNFEYAVPSSYYSLNTKNLAEYG